MSEISCPRYPGAHCIHRHCMGDCVELAYEREKPRVDAELRRREHEGINQEKRRES